MEFIVDVVDDLEIHPYKKATIEWDIYDYHSLPKKADTLYQSEVFKFSNALWRLRLYPNGQRKSHSVTWISFYLVRVSGAENKMHYLRLNMSIKSNDGGSFAHSKGSHCFNDVFKIYGWSHLVPASELLRNWSSIINQNGEMKLCCDITEDLPTESVASQVETIDGLKGLSKDLHTLLHNKEKSDVVIKVQNREFHAHKLILETRSSVFYAMFEHNMRENSTGIVNIDDCDPDTFQDFLHFVYTGKVENLSSENAPRLFALADKYYVEELKEICLHFLKDSLSVDICCEVMAVSDRFNQNDLRESSKKLIVDNIKRLIPTEQWIMFMREHSLLASEILMSVIPC